MQFEFQATLQTVAKQLFDATYGVGVPSSERDGAFKALGEFEALAEAGHPDAVYVLAWYDRLITDWEAEVERYELELADASWEVM